ncbi:MAG: hypothetical protein KDA78_15445 [Planctomycetaceae bacterium]|nr:hypothetical protein [Planctomycetaceae bacterium]
MGDLKNPRLIIFKGLLFLLLGLLSAGTLLAHAPSLTVALLLGLTVWAFCRFYYFAFYVIEKYVDSQYRFAGLFQFCQYLIRNRLGKPAETTNRNDDSDSSNQTDGTEQDAPQTAS